jgi:hypothetical protein
MRGRDKATADLHKYAQTADEGGYHVFIVSLLLSDGGIENGLRQRLNGTERTMSPQAFLPDPRTAQWVLESVRGIQRYRCKLPRGSYSRLRPGRMVFGVMIL